MSIREAYEKLVLSLEALYGIGEAQSMARIVLEDAFGIVHIGSETELLPESEQTLWEDILPRLLQFEPVQYVMGRALFFGLYFKVSPSVLIPRQETEELVAWALQILKKLPAGPETSVLDIGTGSACIPVSIAKKRKGIRVSAIDISPEALEIARKNAEGNSVEIDFQQVDILDESAWATIEPSLFDLIVSNPPYIPQQEAALMPQQVLEWEPKLALFVSNEDPCLFYRKIAQFARKRLKPGGILLFEINEFRAEEVLEILKGNHFRDIELKRDISGANRMVKAEL